MFHLVLVYVDVNGESFQFRNEQHQTCATFKNQIDAIFNQITKQFEGKYCFFYQYRVCICFSVFVIYSFSFKTFSVNHFSAAVLLLPHFTKMWHWWILGLYTYPAFFLLSFSFLRNRASQPYLCGNYRLYWKQFSGILPYPWDLSFSPPQPNPQLSSLFLPNYGL